MTSNVFMSQEVVDQLEALKYKVRPLINIILGAPLLFLTLVGISVTCILPLAAGTAIGRWWAKSLLWIAGVKIDISGLENVDPKRPCIYMPNHASMIDIPILVAMLPVNLRFLFKKELLYIPLFGLAIYLMGMVPIDRGRRTKAKKSLKKAGDRVKEGSHLLIFPEGTRSPDGRLMQFKKGGFYLALEENIDIIPISINGSRKLGGRSSVWFQSGQIRMVVHSRISMGSYNLETRKEAIGRVREIIASGLEADHLPAKRKSA